MAYDKVGDSKVKWGWRDDDDDSADSEEEVEREFYPEKYSSWSFGEKQTVSQDVGCLGRRLGSETT